jgi:hypothetical protein
VSDAWLDIEAPAKAPDTSWLDAPKKIRAKPLLPRASQREALAKALRKLPFAQRLLLKALSQSGWNMSIARRRVQTTGLMLPSRTARSWQQNPDFAAAKELLAEMQLRSTGADPNQILLRVNQIAEHCAEEEEQFHHGEALRDFLGAPILKMRDQAVALRANELLGKNKKLWGDEAQQTRVTINLVDLSGSIDGAERVIEPTSA